MRAPVPPDALPKLSVVKLPPVPPAPLVPPGPGAGHTHAGPVFGYILHGEIENLVEPDPPVTYQTGEVFYEIPMHVHRYLHNLSKTEPADVLVFQAGATGQPVPAIRILMEEPFQKTADQEVSLDRLTLPAGTGSEARPHSGSGIVYVLEGKVEISGRADQKKLYGAGDLFVESTGLSFRNPSESAAAKLLLYEVSER